MSYAKHSPVLPNVQEQLIKEYKQKQADRNK